MNIIWTYILNVYYYPWTKIAIMYLVILYMTEPIYKADDKYLWLSSDIIYTFQIYVKLTKEGENGQKEIRSKTGARGMPGPNFKKRLSEKQTNKQTIVCT